MRNGPPTAHHRGMLPNGSLAWVSTLAIGISAGILLAIFIFIFYKRQHRSTEAAHITIYPRQKTRPARTRRAKHSARRPHTTGGAINTLAAANVHYVTPIEPAQPLPSIMIGTLGNGLTEGPCAAPCITSNTTCPTAVCPAEGRGGTDTYAKAMYPPVTIRHAAGEVATDAALPPDWTGRHGTSPGMATNAPPSTRAHNSACDTYIYSAAAVQCVTPAEPALPLTSTTGTLGNGWAEGPCAITRTSSNTACLTVDCKAEDRGGNKSYKPNNPVTPTKHDAGDATLDNTVSQGGSPGTASKVPTTTMPQPARGIQPTKANIVTTARAAANWAHSDKIKNYTRRSEIPGGEFEPIAVETGGCLHPSTRSALKRFVKASLGIAVDEPMPPDLAYKYQQALRTVLDSLAVALAREVAIALLSGGLGGHREPAEVRQHDLGGA